MTETSCITLALADNIATVRFNRPEHMNTIAGTFTTEFYDTLHRVSLMRDVSVLVLTGEGQAFCAGADAKDRPGDRPESERPGAEIFQSATLLHEMPQVTIAAINGACAGAGLSFAAACDLRYAADSAVFRTAFLSVALSGDFGGIWTLSRIVGAGKARELFFLPDKFSADEALRIGLVSALYPKATLLDEVSAIARRIAENSPEALAAMKANFIAAERTAFTDYVELEGFRLRRLSTGADSKEAFAAFVEKRKPRFAPRKA